MSNLSARELALICVLGVTVVCGGCYQPASGNIGAVPAPPVVAPLASPSATPAPIASPAAPTQLASVVDAAPRNPLPVATPSASATASRSPGSRSPQRKTQLRTKVLDAPEAAGGTRGITFDALVFPIEVGQRFVESMLTDPIREMFGKKVKIRGYIHPSCTFETGIQKFVLVRDDQSCCFGPGALLYDCIQVDMVPGRTTNFSLKPIAVEGVLTLREFKDLDGKHLAIFHLDAEAVE